MFLLRFLKFSPFFDNHSPRYLTFGKLFLPIIYLTDQQTVHDAKIGIWFIRFLIRTISFQSRTTVSEYLIKVTNFELMKVP
jgi:hypothetical protein